MSETPEVTDEDIVEFQAQAAEHLRTQPERDAERKRKLSLRPLDRLIEQADEGGDVTLPAEALLSLVKSEASLIKTVEKALRWDHDCHWMRITGDVCPRCDGGERDAAVALLESILTPKDREWPVGTE